MPQGITYVLGKDCKLFIEEEEIHGVDDVSVREVTTEIDATGYRRWAPSTVVISRGYEIMLSMPDIEAAKELNKRRVIEVTGPSNVTGVYEPVGGYIFTLPQVFRIRLEGGLEDIEEWFTIHGVDADQSLDGAVIPRFHLRSWGSFPEGV